MTKFYQYINEQSDEELERVKEALTKRCMPFLKEFDAPVFRGMGKNEKFKRKMVRKNRRPRLVAHELHEKLNKIFHDRFG